MEDATLTMDRVECAMDNNGLGSRVNSHDTGDGAALSADIAMATAPCSADSADCSGAIAVPPARKPRSRRKAGHSAPQADAAVPSTDHEKSTASPRIGEVDVRPAELEFPVAISIAALADLEQRDELTPAAQSLEALIATPAGELTSAPLGDVSAGSVADATLLLDAESQPLSEAPIDASVNAGDSTELADAVAIHKEAPMEDESADCPEDMSDFDAPPSLILEALLFSSDAPLSLARLAELLDVKPVEARLLIAELNDKYTLAKMAFRIEELAGGYQMLTLPAYEPHLRKLHKARAQTRLSNAALEALAIVAYKQPIIRADIEAIRGSACGEVLNRLREVGLVRIVGRAEIVGRPMLYGTTRKFLDIFGLASLEDLPPMEALSLKKRLEAGTSAAPLPPAELRSVAAGA